MKKSDQTTENHSSPVEEPIPAYYAILPASVRYDSRLKSIQKLIYAEISSLTTVQGACKASSNYFAELYKISRESASRHISRLAECGYIRLIVDHSLGSKRTIWLTNAHQPEGGGVTELSQGCDRTITPPPPDSLLYKNNKQKQPMSTSPTAVLSSNNTKEQKLVRHLFDYWRSKLAHPRAQLDPKRRAKISAALKLGYTADELHQAIEGCAGSEWYQGKNDRGERYDDLELIFRDAKHIEKFLALKKQQDKRGPVAPTGDDPWFGAV